MDNKCISVTTPRVLPQRSWAAATSTILTNESFAALCSPTPLQVSPGNVTNGSLSPLERFLGCAYMRRNLLKLIQSEDSKVRLKLEINLGFENFQLICQLFYSVDPSSKSRTQCDFNESRITSV